MFSFVFDIAIGATGYLILKYIFRMDMDAGLEAETDSPEGRNKAAFYEGLATLTGLLFWLVAVMGSLFLYSRLTT